MEEVDAVHAGREKVGVAFWLPSRHEGWPRACFRLRICLDGYMMYVHACSGRINTDKGQNLGCGVLWSNFARVIEAWPYVRIVAHARPAYAMRT